MTELCWERQVDVDAGVSFHAASVRLETSLAVQHQSQWRINLDPRHQHIVLHWLRVVRDGRVIDQLQRERLRLIQRETQLEHLVIDGQWTLLRVLDDVRVGDAIEYAFSTIGRNPIRPEGCEILYLVPPNLVVGNFKLRVIFSRTRTDIGRLTSNDAPPVSLSELPDGRTCWVWSGSQLTPRESEPNQPSSFIDCMWVQVSDLATWSPVCTRLAEVWKATAEGSTLALQPEFRPPAIVNEGAVVALIQYLQDEYRYLSVDLEAGGWIPQRPDLVATRRYGDCKDLVWLATQVLQSWGVSARPILVATGFRKLVGSLRPMALLFNHAILEVEMTGTRRWFDLTMRLQGGDFHNHWIGEFDAGLPVDASATQLVSQPGQPGHSVYAVRETILLDTRRGETSFLEVRAHAEGPHAENLRRQHFNDGGDEFARERLRFVQRRHPNAVRIGTLRTRDNRQRNTFEVSEAFQIKEVLNPDESGNRALFDVPGNMILQALIVPEDRPRRAPWDMPYPIELRHKIVVRAGGMGSSERRAFRWSHPEFIGTVEDTRDSGEWTKTVIAKTMVTEVMASQIPTYRRVLDQFLLMSTWRLFLPWGHRVGAQPAGFGDLPDEAAGVDAFVAAADLSKFQDPPLNMGEPGSSTPAGKSSVGGRDSTWQVMRFVIPFFIVAMFSATRTCSTTNEEPYDYQSRITSSSPPAPSRPLPPQRIATATSSFLDREKLSPTSPTIHGTVYSNQSDVHKLPAPIYQPTPIYPRTLLQMGLEGQAKISFVVTDSGLTTQIKVESESLPGFGEAATIAVSQWRFEPAMKDGKAVNFALGVPVLFQLPSKQSSKSETGSMITGPTPKSDTDPSQP